MKVAIISPTPLLESLATRSAFHEALAHEYMVDAVYREFYKERVRLGDEVILDNGAYELGEAIPIEDLRWCIKDLNPMAVFLPDVRFDAKETQHRSTIAAEQLYDLAVKLWCVPQGNDLDSILDSYTYFAKQPWCSGFGLYEEIGQVAGLGWRSDFLQFLQERDLVKPSRWYHLLGMEEDLTRLKQLATFDWVDSIDSVKPIVYGLHGIDINSLLTPKYPHRPPRYFKIGHESSKLDSNILDRIHDNISWVLEWAGSTSI